MSFFSLGGIFSKVLIFTKLFFSGTKQQSREKWRNKHTWSRDISDFGHDVDQYEPTGFGHEILDRPTNGASACPATGSAGTAFDGHRHWTHNRNWARLRWGGGSVNWGSFELWPWRAMLFDSPVAVGWAEPEPEPEAEAEANAEWARNRKLESSLQSFRSTHEDI